MRFKVFRGKGRAAKTFYFHVRSSNGKITLASESYTSEAHAHRAVTQVWVAFWKAIDKQRVLQLPPIPYTIDSLGYVKLTKADRERFRSPRIGIA